jgi:hypothetical protein
VLDRVRISLAMRPNTLRASLQASIMHPANPLTLHSLPVKEEIEYENLDAT